MQKVIKIDKMPYYSLVTSPRLNPYVTVAAAKLSSRLLIIYFIKAPSRKSEGKEDRKNKICQSKNGLNRHCNQQFHPIYV